VSRFPPLGDPTLPARRAAQRAVTRAGGVWDRFADWFNGLHLDENTILLAFAVAIGIGGALGVVAFYRLAGSSSGSHPVFPERAPTA
jgi:hypothetical protein